MNSSKAPITNVHDGVSRARSARFAKALSPVSIRGVIAALALTMVFVGATVATARFRQANGEYAARRAKLLKMADGPIVVFGYTGHEDMSEFALFFRRRISIT